jgi:Fic family protein
VRARRAALRAEYVATAAAAAADAGDAAGADFAAALLRALSWRNFLWARLCVQSRAYYAALDAVRKAGEDLSGWIEYCAEGVRQTLENVWLRVQALEVKSPGKLVLRPNQERLLQLLRDHGRMTPAQIWEAMQISRQGAMGLLRPLLDAGMVEKIGGKKTGYYALCQP